MLFIGERGWIAKVSQRYAVTAGRIRAYRFTENVIPANIDHGLKGYGDYGRGTYYSLTPFRWLGHAGIYDSEGRTGFTIVSTVEITAATLPLSSDVLEDVNEGLGSEFATVTDRGAPLLGIKSGTRLKIANLTGWARRRGYAAITIQRGSQDHDTPEGGDQIILVPGGAAKVTPLTYDFVVKSRKVRDAVLADLQDGRPVKGREGAYALVGIKASNGRRLSLLIERYLPA
jgi:hypothetical protein